MGLTSQANESSKTRRARIVLSMMVLLSAIAGLAMLDQKLLGTNSAEGIVARSPATQRVMAVADRVASANAAVLILGETGTGKGRVAASTPCTRPSCTRTIRGGELRGRTRVIARERTVWTREGGIHGGTELIIVGSRKYSEIDRVLTIDLAGIANLAGSHVLVVHEP